MTLPTSTRVTDPYETDGVQRDFEFDFPAFYNADTGHYGIEVRRLTALDYEVIDKSLYDIFLNDEDKSGYIRFHVAPMAGDDIYIAGDTTRSQQLNLINYGRYSAQSIEKAFDLIVALIQEFVSKVDEETRQRILADQALRDFLLIKFNQFTAEVTTKIDKHIGDINGFMSSLIPMFVCIMRKEIANYAETQLDGIIDAKLSDLSIQVANAINENDAALIRLNESIQKIDAATTATAIGARLFDTPAAGVHPVTGVPAGSYFNVRSPSAESYVDEYRNVGGSAVATGKSYPSASAVSEIKEAIIDPVTGKAAASKVFDDSGQSLQILSDLFKRRSENILYASDFNIKGDGTDEAAKVQLMLNAANNKVLNFEGKTVSCGTQVSLANKRKFSLQNGKLKALASSRTDIENRVLFLNQCSDFTSVSFDADGNRQERTPDEKAIHTVTMRSCKNFIVINANWINGVCDNLHFDCLTATILNKSTHTRDGWFINCKFDNAYRNNLSNIVSQNIKFTQCEFTNANGTLPMAGVDIESNLYGGDGLSDNIIFEKCLMAGNVGWQFMPTQHDNPRNIVLDTCTIIAPDVSMYALLNKKLVPAGTAGSTALPDVSNTGGIQVTSPDVLLRNVTFKDFPLGSGTAMRVGANAGAFAVLLGCKFFNIANGTFQTIQVHNLSNGIYLNDKCILKNVTTITLGGLRSEIVDAEIDGVGLISSSSTAGKVIIDRLVAKNGTSSRFIFLESNNAEIRNCELIDLNGASPVAYIQAEKAGAIIENNKCSATNQTQVVGIRFDNLQAKRVLNNECVNLHTATPYYVLNAANYTSAIVSGNTGGTVNISTPVALRGFNTAARPAANAVRQYSEIFDTTLKKKLISDGTNWLDSTGAIV